MYFQQTNGQHNRSHGHRSPNLSQSLPQCLRRLAVLNRFNARTMAGRKYHYTHRVPGAAYSRTFARGFIARGNGQRICRKCIRFSLITGTPSERQNRPGSLLLTYIVFWGVLRGIFRGLSKNIFEKIKKARSQTLSRMRSRLL